MIILLSISEGFNDPVKKFSDVSQYCHIRQFDTSRYAPIRSGIKICMLIFARY